MTAAWSAPAATGGEHDCMAASLDRPRRFVGGMNLDRRFGSLRRANATVPLAVMTIGHGGLRIEAIPLLRRMMPAVALDRADVECVWRSTGLLTPGVGVREISGVHFFWTWRGRRIIELLDGLGYQIGPPGRPRLLPLLGWSRKPIE